MNRINLLPWREELRKRLNKVFLFELGKNVALSIVVIVMIDNYLNHRIDVNNADVLYINTELQKMSPKMNALQGLEKVKKQTLERISIIQSLQQDRFSIVKLLDLMPRVIPEGMYLSLLSRKTKMVPITDTEKNQVNAAPGGALPGGAAGAGGRRQRAEGENRGGAAAARTAALPRAATGAGAKKKGEEAVAMKQKYAIIIQGVSANNADIAVFLKNLQNVKEFEGVKLNEVGIEKGGAGLHFQIEFTQEIGAQG